MSLVNLKNVQATQAFDLLPNGDYNLIVTESKVKTTKNGQGKFIELTLECTDESFAKRKVWHRFNIENSSIKAENIGKSQLKAFLETAGKNSEQLSDANDLLGIRVLAKVGSEERPPYSAQNIIKKWLSAKPVF